MMRRCWVLLPILASLATDCEDASRATAPTVVTSVEIVLESQPASGPRTPIVAACLERLGSLRQHVRPSWRDSFFTSEFDPARVPLVQTALNRYSARFNDVPANTQLTLTVHDENECVRRPVIPGTPDMPGGLSDGRVTTGIFANDTPLRRVVGNDALLLVVGTDGVVSQ